MSCAVSVLLSLVLSGIININVAQAQIVPCYFIFGDSLADNGNNNDVPTDAKANYAPYGIDLPDQPKGRFTNGLTLPDIIGKYLGFHELIPPFLTASGNGTLKGVNYASGGAGIRDETGIRRGVTSLRRQVVNHNSTIETIRMELESETPNHLNKCIYSVYIGSNDYINNYFKPSEYSTSSKFKPDQYAVELVKEYSIQLEILYNLGARKVAINGLSALGCIPKRLTGTSCASEINDAVALFNTELQSKICGLNEKLPGAKFTFIGGVPTNIGSLLTGVPNFGPCCEVASGEELCTPNGKTCTFRQSFLFWDDVHPAEILNWFMANLAYAALTLSKATPYNIKDLALL